jgi:hypothetical protein
MNGNGIDGYGHRSLLFRLNTADEYRLNLHAAPT